MSKNPWADGPSDRPWDDAAPANRSATSAQSSAQNDDTTRINTSGPIVTMEKEEENAWGEASKQAHSQGLGDTTQPARPSGGSFETNPFLRKKAAQAESATTIEPFANLNINDSPANPWQPVDAKSGQEGEKDLWAQQPPPSLIPPSKSPALISLPSGRESPAWDEEPLPNNENSSARPVTALSDELAEESHVWDDLGNPGKGKGKATTGTSSSDDWNLIDFDPIDEGKGTPKDANEGDDEDRPDLPPRQPTAPSTWKPSRSPVDGDETYQIKSIQWHDPSAVKNPRKSPILIQNANGPCPLVALVNALLLTTPPDTPQDTALVQTLRSREQVSLSLLLNAVFDELMSPRRTSSEDELPDVGDLYAFLQSLHTGMNVNPRFIPTPQMVNAYKRTSLTHLHPTERGDLIPGTFENTAEMGLYATFSIPLIHGWLPVKSEPEYGALERRAPSYEDAQNLLFREEELEEKLSDSGRGLNEDEQELYHDILIIKSFLAASATQLTHWGIEVIGKAIRPGTFAILFRNDHFSTLYCHPQTSQLLTLVTDAGFKSHQEIVWETLSDVNGGNTEYLTGEFRVLGGGGEVASSSAGRYSADEGGEWTTVQTKRGKGKQEEAPTSAVHEHEQEDRDLALALQLQEEEDERHRAAEARRRRESILSEQYIEQQARQPRPNIPPRSPRGGGLGGGGVGRGGPPPGDSPRRPFNDGIAPVRTSSNPPQPPRPPAQVVRSLIPPQQQGVTPRTEEATDDAPPSYEQAAHDPAYRPPLGHPNHPQSSSSMRTPSSSSGMTPTRMQPPVGVRRKPITPGVLGSSGPSQRDRDCVVM